LKPKIVISPKQVGRHLSVLKLIFVNNLYSLSNEKFCRFVIEQTSKS
jgi:hypothetical protein